MTPKPFSIAEVMKEFDECFGKDAKDPDDRSIGTRAGCDDCDTNKELRINHKSFLLQTLLSCYEDELREVEGMKEIMVELTDKEILEMDESEFTLYCSAIAKNTILSDISTRLQKKIEEIKALLD